MAVFNGEYQPSEIDFQSHAIVKKNTSCCLKMTIVNLSELSAVSNNNGGLGASRVAAIALNSLHNIHALGHLAEDNVLAVEPSSLDSAEEELRSIGVGSSVGHGEDARASVLEGKVLICSQFGVVGD